LYRFFFGVLDDVLDPIQTDAGAIRALAHRLKVIREIHTGYAKNNFVRRFEIKRPTHPRQGLFNHGWKPINTGAKGEGFINHETRTECLATKKHRGKTETKKAKPEGRRQKSEFLAAKRHKRRTEKAGTFLTANHTKYTNGTKN